MNLKRALSNIARTKNKIANSLTRKSLFVDIDLQQDHGETISGMPFAAGKFRYKSNAQYLPSLTTVLNQYTSGDYKGMKLFDPPPEEVADEWPMRHSPHASHTTLASHASHSPRASRHSHSPSAAAETQSQSLFSTLFESAPTPAPSAAADLHPAGSSSSRGAQGPGGPHGAGLAAVSSTAKMGHSGQGHGQGHGHGHSASGLSVSSSGGILVETVVGGRRTSP